MPSTNSDSLHEVKNMSTAPSTMLMSERRAMLMLTVAASFIMRTCGTGRGRGG